MVLSLYIYIYIYICMCVYICMYVGIEDASGEEIYFFMRDDHRRAETSGVWEECEECVWRMGCGAVGSL